MLDQLTHDIFTAGGGPASHAIPASQHALTLPVKPVVAGTLEFLHELLQDALRDCLIAFGAVGSFIRQDAVVAIVLVLGLVIVVKVCVRRVRAERQE